MTISALLTCTGLGASYEGRKVFEAVSFRYPAGVHALIGANGIGKSTLLRVLAGAQAADEGEVSIVGRSLTREPREARQCLGFAPAESSIYPFMTGEELLHLLGAAKRTGIDALVEGLVDDFGLRPHLSKRFDALSLGTQKKIMLCAAWIGAPKVVILDEPGNGLDPGSRDRLVDLVLLWGRENMVLFATHDLDFAAACRATITDMALLCDQAGEPSLTSAAE